MKTTLNRFSWLKQAWVLVIIGLAVTSCDPNYFYEENQSLASATWSQTDTLKFEVAIEDTLQQYNYLLNLRHTNDYPYRNLFLFVNTVYPNGYSDRDTLQLMLGAADGEWYGQGSGSIYENRVMLKDNITFPLRGIYHFEFVQAMRTETLEGVEDFGIRIEKSEK